MEQIKVAKVAKVTKVAKVAKKFNCECCNYQEKYKKP